MGRETAVWLVGLVWLLTIAGGFWVWEAYDATPGPVRAPGPVSGGDEAAPGRWQLTVFLHPRCPCSRATITEVTTVAAAAPELSPRMLFVLPAGAGAAWERGASWDAAARVPGAEVMADANGGEARRLGAETSGHAVLTDPSGRVVFRGGLTAARGRGGDSGGRRAVLDWVQGRAGAAAAPVFGCPLFAPGA